MVRVGLVGGILSWPLEERARVQATTETLLEKHLPEMGVEVTTFSPRDIVPALRSSSELDVLHIHHPGRLTTVAAFLRFECPVVYTAHRTTLMPDSWLSRVGHLRMLKSSADAVVALSPPEKKWIVGFAGTPEHKVHVVPNGFDTSQFDAVHRIRPVDKDPWVILFVGQLIELKRPEIVLECAARLSRSHKIEVRFAFQKSDLEPKLRAMALENSKKFKTVFLGRLDSRDLRREYSRAHVLVLPSETEALPSVITEAMLSGLPVVAGDVGGIRWQLANNGLCLNPNVSTSFHSGLETVLENYSDFAESAFREIASARARFSLESMIENHVRLYNNVLSA